MLNAEIEQFQRYHPRVQIFEDPKSYRIEAEVPGFRKEDLSIEFPKKHFIRIKGKRTVGGPVMKEIENAAGDFASSESADPVENRNTASDETVEPRTTTASEVSEVESKEVKATEGYEETQVAEAKNTEEVAFTNQWSLPEDVDIDMVKAKLDHGILSIVLPKKGEAEFERKIQIE